jgi:thiaminase/transcriptional activator TenA
VAYSKELRRQADRIWNAIFEHPFLQELEAGTLPVGKFKYYLGQDWQYLDVFGRTIGAAASNAHNSHSLERLADRALQPVEKPLHRKLGELLQLDPIQLIAARPAPTNLAYMNHLMATAAQGNVGEIAAAHLPCPWIYHEIGRRMGEIPHPVYREWAAFYASGILGESVEAWRRYVDEAASAAHAGERATMAQAFLLSSRYEYLFWEMAYRQEEWPV